jgi:hypothetical protein
MDACNNVTRDYDGLGTTTAGACPQPYDPLSRGSSAVGDAIHARHNMR